MSQEQELAFKKEFAIKYGEFADKYDLDEENVKLLLTVESANWKKKTEKNS